MFDGRWRHAVDRKTQPVGRALVRAHVNADVLTVFGLVMSVITAFVVGSGHLVLGIVMLFPTGLPDLFDGPVAKASGTASVRGAFFDSVVDRISDAFLYGGVAWYLVSHHHGTMVLLPFAIVAMTSLISYERAKAELLGLSSAGGLMERAERFIFLGVCFLAGAVDEAAFVPALWVFFGLVSVTAVGRFVRTWQEAEGPVRPVRAQGRASLGLSELSRRRVARWRDLRADSRWRAWREAVAQRNRVPGRGALAPHDDAVGAAGTRGVFHWPRAEPLSRWWAKREGALSTRSGRSRRERRAGRRPPPRLHERASRHPGADGP